ncbi:protease II [Burkholderiales bacterium JOSHI_001]|nr:protease II [Burkholderiales bacterium JOSHI_001]
MTRRLMPILAGLTLFMAAAPAAAQSPVLAIAPAPLPPAPPPAAVRNVPETFFGTPVDDPYRDLEDTAAPSTQAWMRAQADYSRALLDRLPARELMRQRFVLDETAVPARVRQVVRDPSGRWFYLKRGVGDEQFKLVLREAAGGAERVLVDPAALARAQGVPMAINHFSPAPGGRSVAWGVSPAGSEDAVLQVTGTRSGKPLVLPQPRAEMGGVNWAPNGLSFVYTQLQELKPGQSAEDKYKNAQVLLLHLQGLKAGDGVPVFGRGVAGVQIDPLDLPVVQFTHDGRWALGFAINGTAREQAIFISPAAAVLAGRPQWRAVVGVADQVVASSYFNDGLYLLSEKGAPRGELLRLDLKNPDLARAERLLPQGEGVLRGLAAASDALYLERRDGNVKKLFKRAHAATAAVQEVALPLAGSFTLQEAESGYAAADPRLPGAVIELEGWTRARQIFEVKPDGQVVNTGLQPLGPRDARDDVVATEVRVKSHDGALVPMSILHRKDLQLDGRNPVILTGYAAYGRSIEPSFRPDRLAWLDAGGVFAVVNPRGSGVFGADWYRGGWQASKPNTWKDTIACAEWLVANGWTRPQRLGLLGRSAGGVLAGRSVTARPDLFGAAVIQVGLLDAVRGELEPNGPTNIPEFGSRATEAGFRALLAMSTYHQVRDGTRYPALLFTHGVNDPRVAPWHSLKAAARFGAASTSGKPVLLALDGQAGHGVGSTKAQQLNLLADVYAFFGWQLEVEGFRMP